MEKRNPRAGQGARAGVSIASDRTSSCKHRPILKANSVMRLPADAVRVAAMEEQSARSYFEQLAEITGRAA